MTTRLEKQYLWSIVEEEEQIKIWSGQCVIRVDHCYADVTNNYSCNTLLHTKNYLLAILIPHPVISVKGVVMLSMGRQLKKIHKMAICLLVLSTISSCENGEIEPTRASDFDVRNGLPINLGGDGNLFNSDVIMQVNVQMPADEFERLRSEGRTLAEGAESCDGSFQYSEYDASLTIEDTSMDRIVVRKKGYLGSLTEKRPSLKLYLARQHSGRTYKNTDRLTLNNNRQDVSNVRQCLSYTLFRAAGLAAPQCSLAAVTVNGEALGNYSNIEAIREPFLKAHFGNETGNLYEANVSDFGEYLNTRFEKKNNDGSDRKDLNQVLQALAIEDDVDAMEALNDIIDIDYFIRYWAMETLLGNWDSASGNANNFFIYRSQANNKFYFIPWGNDASFSLYHELKPDSSVLYRNFRLAKRLYGIEAYRQRYFEVINHYLETLWQESELEAYVRKVQAQTGNSEGNIRSILNFINGRGELGDENYLPSQRLRLKNAMARPNDNGSSELLSDRSVDCANSHSAKIRVNITSENGFDRGFFRFANKDGQLVNASLSVASIETDSLIASIDQEKSPRVHSLVAIGADTNAQFKPYVLQIFIEEDNLKEGAFSLHGFANSLLLFEVDPLQPETVHTLALSDDGIMTVHSVSQGSDGLNIDLSIDATMVFPESEDGK